MFRVRYQPNNAVKRGNSDRKIEQAMVIQRNKKGLGKAIEVIRKSKDFSIEELADKAGVKPDNLEAIEKGSKAASLLQLHALAKALNSSLLKLLEKANEYKDVNQEDSE